MRSEGERHRIAMIATSLALLAGTAGCEAERAEAEIGEVPEIGELEPQVDEDGVELDEALPLTREEVGDIILATGAVLGEPLADGFFLETEYDQIIFVASDLEPRPGEIVNVSGPLVEASGAAFDRWEAAAFEDELEAEYQWVRLFYIDDDGLPSPGT